MTKPAHALYGLLSPEERFRLILAAGDRGDMVERDRLVAAGGRIELSFKEHAPWSLAFQELALSVFMEFVEYASEQRQYLDWLDQVGQPPSGDVDDQGEEDDSEFPEDKQREWLWDMALAQGFILKTSAAGWRMFCEQLNLPPYAVWKLLPGFERLERSLRAVEGSESWPGAAFAPEGMVEFFRRHRPSGEPAPTLEAILTPERYAKELDGYFRKRARDNGG